MDSHEAEHLMRSLFKTNFIDFVTNGLTVGEGALGLKQRSSETVYIPKIRYREIEDKDLKQNEQHWLHFISQNVDSFQANLAGGRVDGTPTKHTTIGYVKIEIYISKISYHTRQVEKLKTMVQKALLKSNSASLWFRNALPINLDPIDDFFRTDVMAEFQYDFTL